MLIVLLCNCSTENESKQTPAAAPVTTDKIENNNPIQKTEERKIYDYDTVLMNGCKHYNLSIAFDIQTHISKFRDTTEKHDSSAVKLFLTHKKTNKIMDSIFLSSHFYFDHFFMDCNNVRSYSTKMNANKQAADGYYGDIVVADFNFDKKDDLAVINDYGGNSGSFYSYFIQDNNRKFIINRYLTDSMTYFPSEINKNKKTLTTYGLAGACGVGEHIYQFDQKTNTWSETSHRIIGVCDESK